MTRDQIALALQQQQQRSAPGGALGSPFAPAPTLRGPPPVAGNPTPPIAAPIPQHGFETGYKTGYQGTAGKGGDEESKLKMLMQLMAGGG